jgi:uncharacterized protein YukE
MASRLVSQLKVTQNAEAYAVALDNVAAAIAPWAGLDIPADAAEAVAEAVQSIRAAQEALRRAEAAIRDGGTPERA